MRNRPLTWVGVAGFEPAASSSRSQVRRPRWCGFSYLTWARASVSVRWCMWVCAAIVTQLVTQLVSQSARRPAGHRPVQGVISQEAVLAAPLFGVVTFAGDGCLPVLVGGHCVH